MVGIACFLEMLIWREKEVLFIEVFDFVYEDILFIFTKYRIEFEYLCYNKLLIIIFLNIKSVRNLIYLDHGDINTCIDIHKFAASKRKNTDSETKGIKIYFKSKG